MTGDARGQPLPIAEPAETGATGEQSPPKSKTLEAVVVVDSEESQRDRIGAILSTQVDSPTSLAMAIALAHATDGKAAQAFLREQLVRIASERDEWRSRHHEADKKIAILEAKLDDMGRVRRLKQLTFGVGAALTSIGAGTAYRATEMNGADMVLILAGLTLMFVSTLFVFEPKK